MVFVSAQNVQCEHTLLSKCKPVNFLPNEFPKKQGRKEHIHIHFMKRIACKQGLGVIFSGSNNAVLLVKPKKTAVHSGRGKNQSLFYKGDLTKEL